MIEAQFFINYNGNVAIACYCTDYTLPHIAYWKASLNNFVAMLQERGKISRSGKFEIHWDEANVSLMCTEFNNGIAMVNKVISPIEVSISHRDLQVKCWGQLIQWLLRTVAVTVLL